MEKIKRRFSRQKSTNNATPSPNTEQRDDQTLPQAGKPTAATSVDGKVSNSAVVDKVDTLTAELSQRLATGNVSPEDQIARREAAARICGDLFEIHKDPKHLATALQHYRAILRLLRSPSAERAKFLEKLAYNEMSEFQITKSMKTLDDSIAHSIQAQSEAPVAATALRCMIYHNLGYSLGNRAVLTDSSSDIDEAIDCGREVLCLGLPDNPLYNITLSILASRLQTRYSIRRNDADISEALSLLDQQANIPTLSAWERQAVMHVRSKVLFERFKDSKLKDDIGNAIICLKEGLIKIRAFGDTGHVNEALAYDRAQLLAIPKTYVYRVERIGSFLRMMSDFAYATDNLQDMKAMAAEAQGWKREVAENSAERHFCNMSLLRILSKQYILSRDVGGLEIMVSHAHRSGGEYNATLNTTQPQSIMEPLRRLQDIIMDVQEAHPCPVRSQTIERLYECYQPFPEGHKIFEGLQRMYDAHKHEFEFRAKNLTGTSALSREGNQTGITLSESQQAKRWEEDRTKARPTWFNDRDDFINPLTGLRYLASSDGRITMHSEVLVNSIMGYDENENPKSLEAFLEREARLEKERFDEEKRKETFEPKTVPCL